MPKTRSPFLGPPILPWFRMDSTRPQDSKRENLHVVEPVSRVRFPALLLVRPQPRKGNDR